MIGAGLLAKKAVERGLSVAPYVKTSLAPGSTVVTRYLDAAGLTPYLDRLGFNLVGYGCTTCIGNSGPLPESVAAAIAEGDLVAAAVLSGNRNFEGRVHPHVRANYLASPPLVVAYALAGTIDIDLSNEPLGRDEQGRPVLLREIWPHEDEIQAVLSATVAAPIFDEQYSSLFVGSESWNTIPLPSSQPAEGSSGRQSLYEWVAASTYIQEPPFFSALRGEPPVPSDIRGARVLALLGDSVTTDHVSPAGSIAASSPAGRYLLEREVARAEFNSYGSRRGNHEVMMRGTFANIRLRNLLVPGVEGGITLHLPAVHERQAPQSSQQATIYDAAMRYQAEGVPLIVVAGREYGTGSSRDWAAKGTFLLGVRAVIAQSYERIHRTNLVGMGVLPLQFLPGESAQSHGLTGHEVFDIQGIEAGLEPGQHLLVSARRPDGHQVALTAVARLDTPVEVAYYRNGGILNTVLLRILGKVAA
jgi:aconitate hydratase